MIGNNVSIVAGSNQGGSNLTLKGWPLMQQNSIMQSQSFPPLQLLNPQQQQLLIQEQQSTMSPSLDDIDNQRLRMLLNNGNIVFGKDCVPNVVDVSQNAGSPIQAVPNVLPRGDTDMLIKVHLYTDIRSSYFGFMSCVGICYFTVVLTHLFLANLFSWAHVLIM